VETIIEAEEGGDGKMSEVCEGKKERKSETTARRQGLTEGEVGGGTKKALFRMT